MFMQEHNAGRPKPAPLRRVIETFSKPVGSMGGVVWRERLECGHEVSVKQDIYGETNAARRRCKQCLSNPAKKQTA